VAKKQSNITQYLHCLLLAFFLAGCATPPPPSIQINSNTHQLLLAKLDNWTVKGKLGFKGPEKNQSANFRWRQNTEEYQLNLTSILGTSLLSMVGNKTKVTMIADDQTYQDSDPTDLIYRITGWHIPVDKLRLWIKGQHQTSDKVLRSEQGWVTQLQPVCNQCQEWLITYNNYKLVNKIWLPHSVKLKNTMNKSQLLIKINSWALYE
jgi:outer membrane lipoprotein LolB